MLRPTLSKARRTVLVGVRREDGTRIWERRAPLTPDAVNKLVSTDKVVVEVESCSRRVFTDAEYAKAGARIVHSLTATDIVLGVKEPPLNILDSLIGHKPNHVQLMFSHTIKGQEYNMPLLARFLMKEAESSLHPTLVDYELLADANGKRTVGFGWFAGAAGVLEAFSSMAQFHLEKGVASPFLYTGRPYTHKSLEEMRATLRNVGAMIRDQGIPEHLGPFIVGLTGSGNVSQGALDLLKELPLTQVLLQEELEPLVLSQNYDRHTIYLLHCKPGEYLRRIDGKPYDREDYYAHPEEYESVFHDKIAPYLTLFINGVGWTPKFPRLLSNDQLPSAMAKASRFNGYRFTNIADISCDVKGGLELLTKATTLSSPFYDIEHASLPSIRMMSVDILPASMPLDASKHFSSALQPYLADLIEHRLTGQAGDHSPALESATIAKMGDLTERHKWLRPLAERFIRPPDEEREEKKENEGGVFLPPSTILDQKVHSVPQSATEKENRRNKRKRILLLGSGMVAQPVVDYLVCKHGVKLMIVSNNHYELKALAAPYDSVETACVVLTKPARYEEYVRNAEVVISLLPADMHHEVAQVCISARKPLVTASYTSREMENLDAAAREEGVLILTEMGLDPGLDHLSAVSLIDKLVSNKKRIVSFTSMCGGLPAPDCAHDVPLKYRFSWRPQGVLSAALQDAFYVLFGEVQRVRGDSLLEKRWESLPIASGFDFEGLPNRDSFTYLRLYRLHNMRTFVRGTLRYRGYSSLLNSFKKLGLLNTKKEILPAGWHTFVRQSMQALYELKDGHLPPLAKVIPEENLQSLHDAVAWLGLPTPGLDSVTTRIMPPLPLRPETPLTIFAYLLSEKLRYGPGDKDMVVLSHEIVTDGFDRHYTGGPRREEVYTSTLLTYKTDSMHAGYKGERPASAMARTVGLPAAMAAILIAEGKIILTGVRRPLQREIYQPVLEELAQMGIVMREKSRKVTRDKTQTVEGAMLMSAGPGEKKRWLAGQAAADPSILDLDAFEGWKEDECVNWASETKKARILKPT